MPVFRYDKHMPKTGDLTLIVLKGHLLVEEQLVDLAKRTFPNPQFLPELTFYKLAHIVRATIPQRSDDSFWNVILMLNKLRNTLAHKLESDKHQATLRELFRIHDHAPISGTGFDKIDKSSMSEPDRLRMIVQECMVFLIQLAG